VVTGCCAELDLVFCRRMEEDKGGGRSGDCKTVIGDKEEAVIIVSHLEQQPLIYDSVILDVRPLCETGLHHSPSTLRQNRSPMSLHKCIISERSMKCLCIPLFGPPGREA